MTVTLCVKKIYNTLIYITVKYYKLYDNTYIKKKKFFPFKKEFNHRREKKGIQISFVKRNIINFINL